MNRVLIARDEAFNFIYRANIDALKEIGTVKFFSPLHDELLPPCDLLYLPGGYPELFLPEIRNNHSICQQIYDYAQQGGRILAECGGFMYLCNDIDNVFLCIASNALDQIHKAGCAFHIEIQPDFLF